MSQINWIKCSEQMPPDDSPIILNDVDGCILIHAKKLTPVATDILLKKFEFQWIPYTEEAWKELSK